MMTRPRRILPTSADMKPFLEARQSLVEDPALKEHCHYVKKQSPCCSIVSVYSLYIGDLSPMPKAVDMDVVRGINPRISSETHF